MVKFQPHSPPDRRRVLAALDALGGLRALVDEAVIEPIRWQGSNPAGETVTREARLPRVIFTR